MHIDPTREQFDEFKALPRDVPIYMLNLIKLRQSASYADKHSHSTGWDAYQRYGEETAPILKSVGGEIFWRGKPQAIVIGPGDEHWDIAFIAKYPSAAAFLAMITNPDYRLAVKHRQAAVADSRLIRLGEALPGESFA